MVFVVGKSLRMVSKYCASSCWWSMFFPLLRALPKNDEVGGGREKQMMELVNAVRVYIA